VHVRDVLRAVRAGDLEAERAVTARDLAREVPLVPENRRIDEVLRDLRERETQMAVVIDEWGSFEGIVTIEDILEEIVGEIRDEFDEEEPAVRELDEGDGYSVDGGMPIGAVNEILGSDLESEDFGTVGGLVLGHLGRAPKPGDEVALDGHVLRVDEVDGARISRVTVRKKGRK
ncbi:MAG: transporter associated domain-containing protein, partial [Rubrobacter sp.]